MNNMWHSIKSEEVIEKLNSSIDGISNEEALNRIGKYGKNVLPHAKKDTLLKVYLRQFINPIIYMLLLAIILSIVVGEYIDALFIGLVILLDTSLGTFQEWKSEKNAEALQKLIKVETKVLRNNKEIVLNSEDIIVGDIIIVESGDKIPADSRIISSSNLLVNEAILTGESLPSEKHGDLISEESNILERKNMLYAGTDVVRGRCKAIVVAIGIETEIGGIANRVLLTDDTESPLSIRMEKFTKQIGIFTAFIALIIAIILYYEGYILREIFFSVVALSVSAIPEGLPLVITMVLSIASNKMAKKNVLVKKLKSVESLGSCTVIASDKTGTLTLNEQTAKKIIFPNNKTFEITGIGYNDEGTIMYEEKEVQSEEVNELVRLTVLNNEAYLKRESGIWDYFGDSIDVAFLSLGKKLYINKEELNIEIVDSIPYESYLKYSAVFYKENNETYCTVKGSPERIMEFCDTFIYDNNVLSIDKELIKKQNENLAKNGYRVIAVAKGKVSNNLSKYRQEDIKGLSLIGLVGFIDPVREETVFSVKECNDASIKTVMITGDHPLTAFHIAKELNIIIDYHDVATGIQIDEMLKNGYKEFDVFVKSKKVFARVNPNQKYEIIESYKRQGEFVAVTGDGVNDALALKSANIGIAMGSGTDIAKETSSMIIADDNFASIVTGIREGRNAYDNVRKVIYMLLSCGLAEVLFFILSISFGLPIPLIALQLLWLNLVTDGIQDIALAFEKGEPDSMKKRPRKPKENIFNGLLIKELLIAGIFTGIIVFILFKHLIDSGMELTLARSYVMLLMVFIQNIHVFNCRSESRSAFKIPLKDNKFIVYSILGVLTLQFIVTNNSFLSGILKLQPIPLNHIIFIFLLAIPILLLMELFKYYNNKTQNNK